MFVLDGYIRDYISVVTWPEFLQASDTFEEIWNSKLYTICESAGDESEMNNIPLYLLNVMWNIFPTKRKHLYG